MGGIVSATPEHPFDLSDNSENIPPITELSDNSHKYTTIPPIVAIFSTKAKIKNFAFCDGKQKNEFLLMQKHA